jgi:hypothetical protein
VPKKDEPGFENQVKALSEQVTTDKQISAMTSKKIIPKKNKFGLKRKIIYVLLLILP